MGFLSDLFNLLYYFTDHYTLAFLVRFSLMQFGLFTNKSFEYEADYWGTIFWIISNVFLAVNDLLVLYRLRREKGKAASKQVYFTQADFLRNVIDTFIAFCFFEKTLISKKAIGLMGVGSSVILLADFWK